MVPKKQTYTAHVFAEKPSYGHTFPRSKYRRVTIYGPRNVKEYQMYGLHLPNTKQAVVVYPPFVNLRFTKQTFPAPRKALHKLVTGGVYNDPLGLELHEAEDE